MMGFDFFARGERLGYVSAVVAFSAWGVYPLFFKQLAGFGAAEVLAHRILWSFVILLAAFAATSRLQHAWRAMWAPGCLKHALLSAGFLSINWYCFIVAVNTGRVLESSLGYFLLPVVSMIFGALFFGEYLNRLKIAAMVVAGGGFVAAFLIDDIVPIIPITLAVTFGAYGMLRKQSRLDSATGLFVETLALCPFAVVFLVLGGAWFPRGAVDFGLLFSAGLITLLPLFTMVIAARRIQLNTLGFLQYITPIGHFLIAWLIYNENISGGQRLVFATTWVAIALYSLGLAPRWSRSARQNAPRQ